MAPELEAAYDAFLLMVRSLNLKWQKRENFSMPGHYIIRTEESHSKGPQSCGDCPILAIGRRLSPKVAKWTEIGNGSWATVLIAMRQDHLLDVPPALGPVITAVADDAKIFMREQLTYDEFNRLRNMMLDACGLSTEQLG